MQSKASQETKIETTLDRVLNQRLTLMQPKQGFRIAVDTVLLAAATLALPGDCVLDLGCGVGGAMLSLACRVADTKVTGIEIQPELVGLCEGNIIRNQMQQNCRTMQGDVAELPEQMMGQFDHVMMNPPYHDATTHNASPNKLKRVANTEQPDDLPRWIGAAVKALKNTRSLTIIHRADRTAEIVQLLQPNFNTIKIKPLLSKAEQPAKRVLVRAQRGFGDAIITNISPLVLHQPSGAYTLETEHILRHLGAIDFQEN